MFWKGEIADSPGRIWYPSAKITLSEWPWPKGIWLVVPASLTPGSARIRSKTSAEKRHTSVSSG